MKIVYRNVCKELHFLPAIVTCVLLVATNSVVYTMDTAGIAEASNNSNTIDTMKADADLHLELVDEKNVPIVNTSIILIPAMNQVEMAVIRQRVAMQVMDLILKG